MRVCAKCLCASPDESMAAAYEMLGWKSGEFVRPDSLDVERLRRMGCSCGDFLGHGLLRAPLANARRGPLGMRNEHALTKDKSAVPANPALSAPPADNVALSGSDR